MKLKFARLLSLLLVWMAGLVVFDGILSLQGPWLMLGGAMTFIAMEVVSDVFLRMERQP